MYVSCEWYVLPGRGLCDGLITRPEESYRLWCIVVCDLLIEEDMDHIAPQHHKKKSIYRNPVAVMIYEEWGC